MSDAAYFEQCSNKELHAQCLLYGLPNVPITNSNRNMFIKRLQTAMQVDPTGPLSLEQMTNKQLRAECIKWELPNVPVTDSSRSVLIRRLHAVINGDEKQQKVAKNPTTTKSPVTKRRSNNTNSPSNNNDSIVVAQKQKEIIKSPLTLSNISPLVLSSSDESSDERKPFRRSPSPLSKSGVLTTSYVHEIKPLPRHVEEMDFDEYEEEVEQEPITTPQFYTHNNNNNVSMSPNNYNTPLLSPSMTSSPYEVSKYEPSIGMTSLYDYLPQAAQHTQKPQILSRSSVTNTSTEAPVKHRVSVKSNRVHFQEEQFKKPLLPPTRAAKTISPVSAPKLYPNLQGLYERSEQEIYNDVRLEDDNESESDEVSQIELSSDDEPLIVASSSSHYGSPTTSIYQPQQQSQRSPILRRSRYSNNNVSFSQAGPPIMRKRVTTTTIDKDDVTSSLHNFFDTLDKRYHLKQLFSFILAFLLVAFIYAFFF